MYRGPGRDCKIRLQAHKMHVHTAHKPLLHTLIPRDWQFMAVGPICPLHEAAAHLDPQRLKMHGVFEVPDTRVLHIPGYPETGGAWHF